MIRTNRTALLLYVIRQDIGALLIAMCKKWPSGENIPMKLLASLRASVTEFQLIIQSSNWGIGCIEKSIEATIFAASCFVNEGEDDCEIETGTDEEEEGAFHSQAAYLPGSGARHVRGDVLLELVVESTYLSMLATSCSSILMIRCIEMWMGAAATLRPIFGKSHLVRRGSMNEFSTLVVCADRQGSHGVVVHRGRSLPTSGVLLTAVSLCVRGLFLDAIVASIALVEISRCLGRHVAAVAHDCCNQLHSLLQEPTFIHSQGLTEDQKRIVYERLYSSLARFVMVVPETEEKERNALLLQVMNEMSNQLHVLSQSLTSTQKSEDGKLECGWLSRGISALVGLKGLLQGLRQEDAVRPYLSGVSRVLMNVICAVAALLQTMMPTSEVHSELYPFLLLATAAECSLLELRPDAMVLRDAIRSSVSPAGTLAEPSITTLATSLGKEERCCTSNNRN